MRYTSPLIREILKSPSGKEALNRITPIYMESRIGLWILETIGLEIDELKGWTKDVGVQILPQTTTWAIDNWEHEYGIKPNHDLPLEVRRLKLLNVIRARAPMNPAKLIKLIKNEINNQTLPIEIIENIHRNTFQLKVTPGSFNTNWYNVRRLIDKVKPAHVIYTIMMYDLQKFLVPILVDLMFKITSFIFIRPGMKDLLLNGTWLLDGLNTMNGFEGLSVVDYYPLSLLLMSDVKVPIKFKYDTLYSSYFKFKLLLDSKLNMLSRFYFRNNEMFLLDGEYYLDGSMYLSGYKDKISRDFYPLSLFIKDFIDANISVSVPYKFLTASKFNYKINNNQKFKSDFIFRSDPEKFYLDGKRSLNGYFNLRGYKDGCIYEYYPISLRLNSSTNQDINYSDTLKVDKDLWHLDGQITLNGDHRLIANSYNYNL